ncbi:MAG: hypothetical protein AAGF11_31230 [Myxococcota bacterium]
MRWSWSTLSTVAVHATAAVAVAAGVAVAGGCKKNDGDGSNTPGANGSDSGGSTTSSEPDGPILSIHVRSTVLTNDGRPLYGVVRAVSLKDFVEDGYQGVADLVVEPDDSVLATFMVFPGIEFDTQIPKPEAKTVAIYCLFTEATGGSWKRLFEEPESIDVSLGADRLEEEEP